MKASELIDLYKQGRRNFSREDLSGENFDGQELSDINLSHADIRGASFVNANLTGANFTYAQAGTRFEESFFRTIYQLSIACIAMNLSIYYSRVYASMYAQLLNGDLEPVGLGFLFGMYLYPSLLFLIFSATWIKENWSALFWCYFTSIFVVNILIYYFTNKTTLIGGFVADFITLAPLITLVSTTVHYIVESLPYQGTWMGMLLLLKELCYKRQIFIKPL